MHAHGEGRSDPGRHLVWVPPAELTAAFPRRSGSRLVAATVRRVLARVNADALDRAIGAWLAAQ